MMTPNNNSIEQQLRAAWKQERRFIHMRGLCRSVIWLVLLVFLGLLIDWGVLFKARIHTSVSVLLGLIGLGTLAWVVYREWWRHLRPFDATRVALEVEAKHPELMSSLSSYTQMDTMVSDSQASPQLIEAMRDFAVQSARKLTFTDIVDFAQIKKLAIYACAALLLAGAMSVQWSEYLGAMARRVTGQGADYPIRTQLVEISGDLVVAQGNPVDIEVKAGGVIPSTAVLHVRPKGESGGWTEMPMDKLANGFTFRRALESPDRDLQYYITMGDYRSEAFDVVVVAAPRLEQVQVHVEHPAYLDRPAITSDQLNQEVPEGSRIRWELKSDMPVENLSVLIGDERIEATVANNGTDITFTLPAERNFTYTFEWTEGTSGKAFTFEDVQYSVKTIKDNRPRITFEGRPPQGIATVNKTANIAWQAKDDYGLGEVYLVYTLTKQGQSEDAVPQRIAIKDGKGRTRASETFTWAPGEAIPDLKPGIDINYYLETADLKPNNGEEGGRVARSPVKKLSIVTKEAYVTWFRRELATRNDAVTGVFKNELEVSQKVKELLPKQEGDQP